MESLKCSLCGEPVRNHTHFKGLLNLWKEASMDYPIMRFFDYKHLNSRDLQDVSGQFFDVAHSMLDDPRVKDGAEKSAGFRKLLEAKDCFVRATLP